MEFTLKTIVIMLLLLVGALVFVTLMVSWATQSDNMFVQFVENWMNALTGN